MNDSHASTYARVALLFTGGGVVTAAFSSSLIRLAHHASATTIIAAGMLIPCFTWVVSFIASAIGMNPDAMRRYWLDLGVICLLGSFALLPAAALNWFVTDMPLWPSAANVLVSVLLMAIVLFVQSKQTGRSMGWPIAWCVTICVNMTIFATFSRSWW